MNYTAMLSHELESAFERALRDGAHSKMHAILTELRRRTAGPRAGSGALKALARLQALLAAHPPAACPQCELGECPGGHVYVVEIQWRGEWFLYVGSTGKTVEERFEDNFKKDGARWKYGSKAPRMMRAAGRGCLRLATELFAHLNPVGPAADRRGLERAERRLADELWRRGMATYSDQLPESRRATWTLPVGE